MNFVFAQAAFPIRPVRAASVAALLLVAALPLPRAARAQPVAYDAPFFPGADHDPAVTPPERLLGFRAGDALASCEAIERCLRAWEDSPRMTLTTYARSWEGRPLHYAVLTSPRNHARLAEIRAEIARLADPRKLAADENIDARIRDLPAIAWIGCSIHGDETSGADAGLALIHHLVADRTAQTQKLLDDLVICIDATMNPDGRERFIQQVQQHAGVTPNLDPAALQHSGAWPTGRMNHYLCDLNRDWIFGVHPETRGRRTEFVAWNPQLLVDAHEMWPNSSFLFNPAREPFNPGVSPVIRTWWLAFSNAQALAFDAYGWSYYTREWADFWYPGYSDGWACLHGAVGMLFEQAGTGGTTIRQDTGGLLTYREAVHHQAIGMLSNLRTLQANRAAILRDFVGMKRAATSPAGNPGPRYLVVPPTANRARLAEFSRNLREQGIEIGRQRGALTGHDAVHTLGGRDESRTFPAGTLVIDRLQPRGTLVTALLDFDPRVDDAFLQSERKSLEARGESRLYDVTAWSLPLACALDAYWCARLDGLDTEPLSDDAPPPHDVDRAGGAYAYWIDGASDASARAAVHLLQAGVVTRVAERAFTIGTQRLEPGSLLIRRHENQSADLVERLAAAAEAAGVSIGAVPTARSATDTPDLGGEHFLMLDKPRVALFGGPGVDPYNYGEIWRLLDVDLGQPVSLFSIHERGGFDARRYNVVILPNTEGGDEVASLARELKPWVESGGTLIAIAGAAELLASEDAGLSAVRRREDVLDTLDAFSAAVELERRGRRESFPLDGVWENAPASAPAASEAEDAPAAEGAEALDAYRRRFAPTGVILRAESNPEHWLAFGCPAELPVFAAGSRALLSRTPTQTPVRFATRERLRLAGLLWPEAALRLADSAAVTAERVGSGQVILFAQDPVFRGGWPGTRRLLVNAVVFGPGCGADAPAP